MSSTAIAFDWRLTETKLRDGRYGPIFLGLRIDTSEMIIAEQIQPLDAPSLERVLSYLEKRKPDQGEPNVVPYLGYQRKDGHIFLFTRYYPGGTLREFIETNGTLTRTLARSMLRQIALGIEQLQNQDNTATARVEAPLLDTIGFEQQVQSGFLTLPERILGQQNISKADVWLLGIVAVQMLSNKTTLTASASDAAAQVDQNVKSAWELFIPSNVASELDEETVDFLRHCFTINIDERPGISTLLEHSFLKS